MSLTDADSDTEIDTYTYTHTHTYAYADQENIHHNNTAEQSGVITIIVIWVERRQYRAERQNDGVESIKRRL